MRDIAADLHIHTALSPCGDLAMSPRAIVAAAVARGLDLIAITDHNTARMTEVVAREARRHGIAFLYGLELQTQEDVHLLAYFDDGDAARAFSDEIYALLPARPNVPDVFGDQVAVDDDETIVYCETKLLVNSLRLEFGAAVDRITRAGGLAVPAHVDRAQYGLIPQLGLAPEGVDLPLVEADGDSVPPELAGRSLLWSSDAHTPDAIGRRFTVFHIEAPTTSEIRLAARGERGRTLRVVRPPALGGAR